MNKTRAKLAPKYKQACEKLGELEFQKLNILEQLKPIQKQIDDIHTGLKGLEFLFPLIEEFEKELTTKEEPEVD